MFSFALKSNAYGTLPLKHEPIGWDSMKYEYKRSEDYFGITKLIGKEQLGFIKEGKDYISNIVNSLGIEEEITLEVYQEVNFVRELYFTGKLDLKEYLEEDEIFNVDVEQSGFTVKFLNQDEVPIDISKHVSLKGSNLTIVEPIEVPLHSKIIQKSFIAAQESDFTMSLPYAAQKFDEFEYAYAGLETTTSNEIADVYNLGVGFFANDPFDFFDVKESGNYIFEIFIPVQILVKVREYTLSLLMYLTYKLNDEAEEDLAVHELPVLAKNTDYEADYDGQTNIFTYVANFNANFEAGDKVKLYFRVKLNPLYGTQYTFITHKKWAGKEAKIKITGGTTFPETTCLGTLPFETFTRVCEAITDKTEIFESTLFGRTDSLPVAYDDDGDASLYLCTDGKQIRNLPIGEHPLTFNFKDLFNSFDAKHNIGVGIEKREGKEVIVIEKKEYFFKNVLIADLGMVTGIKKSLAVDYFNNTVKIGYDKFENEVVNGIDEIATETQYSTPITQVKNEYKRLSPYRADGYGIETARRLSDKPTTDSSYDEDNFLICLLRDGEGYKTEQDSSFDYILNVISPSTIYNARDTPARMLRRHGNMIKAGLLHHQFENLKFVKGKANSSMVSKMTNQNVITENADVFIDDLDDPLIIPEFHEFDHPAKSSLMKLIEANPYGYFSYKDRNNISYKSYIQSVEFTQGKASFKLIRKYGTES